MANRNFTYRGMKAQQRLARKRIIGWTLAGIVLATTVGFAVRGLYSAGAGKFVDFREIKRYWTNPQQMNHQTNNYQFTRAPIRE